jgi:hypothetical protein
MQSPRSIDGVAEWDTAGGSPAGTRPAVREPAEQCRTPFGLWDSFCTPLATRGFGPTRSATACSMEREHALRQRSYSVLISSSLSRLAVMDSSSELVPLIHSPPSRRRV